MTKKYRFRATRAHPNNKPFVKEDKYRLIFSSIPQYYSAKEALELYLTIGMQEKYDPRGWVMEAVDD